METRPRVKLNLNQFDKVLEIGGIILLVVMWILTVFNYLHAPETVPTHFNFSGKVDDYGNKGSLLFLPIIPTVLYFVLTKLNQYPHIFNYLTKITTENATRQYTIATRLIRLLKVSILLICVIDALSTLLITLGIFSGLGAWFLPFTILILNVPTVYAIFKSLSKNEKMT